MSKPTNKQLFDLEADGLAQVPPGTTHEEWYDLRRRILHDAGIAHGKAEGKAEGWREAIEALRAREGGADAAGEFWSRAFWKDAALYLERIGKERGYV